MKKYTCKICQNEFFSFNVNPTFCSLRCKGIFQQKGLPEKEIIDAYINGKTLLEIRELYGGSQKSITNVLKRNNVPLRKAIKRNQSVENNDSWKGDKAKYARYTERVKAAFGTSPKMRMVQDGRKQKI